MKNPLNAWFGDKGDKAYVLERWKQITEVEQQFLSEAWSLRQEALDTDMPAEEHDRRYQELIAQSKITEEQLLALNGIWNRGRPELSQTHQGKERR